MNYFHRKELIIHIANHLAKEDGHHLDFPAPDESIYSYSDVLVEEYANKAFKLYESLTSWIYENSPKDKDIQSIIKLLRAYIEHIDRDAYRYGAINTLDILIEELGVQEGEI